MNKVNNIIFSIKGRRCINLLISFGKGLKNPLTKPIGRAFKKLKILLSIGFELI